MLSCIKQLTDITIFVCRYKPENIRANRVSWHVGGGAHTHLFPESSPLIPSFPAQPERHREFIPAEV